MKAGRLNALARLDKGPVRLVHDNRASRIYLALVAAAAVFVAVDTLFVRHDDASFAGVWLFALAAPTVFLFFAGGSLMGESFASSSAFGYVALIASVLIQAAAIGAFVRLLLRDRTGPVRTPREA
ncbi:SCO4225 family membrane protein [Streptomyces sp. NPDC059943]|uniref:SCO4225 family membrane protein n=1 Tax=Streptomyces sp. NPDC059943 TaxID=3347010 RepID=UPI00365125EA